MTNKNAYFILTVFGKIWRSYRQKLREVRFYQYSSPGTNSKMNSYVEKNIKNCVVGMRIGNPHGNTRNNCMMQWVLSHFEAICSLADRQGYYLEQRNGQRVFGPPIAWNGPEPSKDCEIFIGRIPKGVFENTLMPLLAMHGRVYNLRLMMDFSGNNRGFAFATYSTVDEAQKACSRLDHYEIIPGRYLGVVKSLDNNSISLSDVPYTTDIIYKVTSVTIGVTNVIISKPFRGYSTVTITYNTHRAAALARRYLMQTATDLFYSHRLILVDWTVRHPRTSQNSPQRPSSPPTFRRHYQQGNSYPRATRR